MELRQLSPEEIRKLNGTKLFLTILGIIIIAIFVAVVLLIFKSGSKESIQSIIGFGVSMLVFIGVVIYLFVMAGKCAQDLSEGMAAIEVGIMTSKYAYRNGYGIVFNGKKYGVNREAYKTLQKGQQIEVHYAPRSRQVFVIKDENGIVYGDK